jgi:hypothetical protein
MAGTMTQPSARIADVELYPGEATSVAAIRPLTGERRELRLPLPEWVTPPEVVDREGVTRLRPSDTGTRDDRVRPGLRSGPRPALRLESIGSEPGRPPPFGPRSTTTSSQSYAHSG